MDEEFKPGHYTALQNLNIRAAMNTQTDQNLVGRFFNGNPFTVYEVFPETGGIVWGRVSSNTGGGTARYVALRVNNHPKVKMEKALEDTPPPPFDVPSMDWARDIDQWARLNGFKGPKPG
jgi:hypothetical protein